MHATAEAPAGAPLASPPPAVDAGFRHFPEAFDYGKRAAELRESVARTWDDVAPLLASGWAGYHSAVCDCRLDWRLSFSRVKQGWLSAHQ